MNSLTTPSDEKRDLLLITLFSFAVRILAIQFKDGVGTDETLYLLVGKNLWEGKGFSLLGHPMTMVPPLLPLVSGVFSLFTHNLELGTDCIYVVSGTLTVLPLYFLVREIHGPYVARIASLLLALYSPLLLSFYWGSMTEPLYTFLIMVSLFALYRAIGTDTPAQFAVSGLLCALAYLCRSEGCMFFAVFSLYLLGTYGIRRELFKRAFLARMVPFVLSFLLLSMPYPLFIKKHTGSLSISGKIKLILLAGAMDLRTREGYVGRLAENGESFVDYGNLVKDKTVLDMIMENPKVLLGGSFLQIKNFVTTLFSWKVYPFFLAPFLLLGIFYDPWDRKRLRDEVFLLVSCIPFLVFLTFFIWPRYLLPMTPILLIWTARGAYSLERWISATSENLIPDTVKPRRIPRAIPMVLIVLPLMGILAAKPIKAKLLVQYPIEYKAAGAWMDAHVPKDALILARKPEIAYYARRLMHPLPNEELPAILHYARTHAIRYLVVDEFSIVSRPQLEYLLKEEAVPEGLALLYEGASVNGRKIKVFQIN